MVFNIHIRLLNRENICHVQALERITDPITFWIDQNLIFTLIVFVFGVHTIFWNEMNAEVKS